MKGAVRHPPLLGLALLGAQAVVLALVFPFAIDDGYIVGRYAENWVDGLGPVFNAGERINALSSPLHLLIEALLYRATGQTLLANKLLAVLAVNGVLLAAVWSERDRGDRWLLAALCLPSPFVWLWAVGGLETPYLLALVTGLVLLVRGAGGDPSPRRALAISLLAGLAFLARFDASLFAAPALAHLVWRQPRRTALLLLPGLALSAGWLVFAWSYYGDVLPTSFHTKTPRFTLERAAVNAVYLAQFAVLCGAAGLAAGPLARLRTPRGIGRALAARGWLWAGLAAVAIYGLAAATLHMMFAYRLLVPYLPALALALLDLRAAARRSGAGTPRARRSSGPTVLALVGLQLGVMALIELHSLNPGLLDLEFSRESLRNLRRNVPRVMEEAASAIARDWSQRPASGQRAPRLLTPTAGILPYHYRELYVYEQLVSWRRRCRYDVRGSTDYQHVLVPHNGPLELQLGAPPEDFELVSRHDLEFDGVEARSLVFFRPAAGSNRLPARVAGACLAPDPAPAG